MESPDESGRLFVIDQVGKIWVLDDAGNKETTPFLDITDKMTPLNPNYDERGLLGLAFHPGYQNNGRFFVYYTAPPNAGGPEEGETWNNISRISEFAVSANNPALADAGSEKIILEVDQPQGNHEGGTIAFGPDGYLYISIGDGGAANDVAAGHVEDWYDVNAGGNGQDIESNLLGDILRIDVNGSPPYAIPSDNPFIDHPGLDEIYAYGFRNPFRFSFDMGGSNVLLAGDAGQNLFEEINLVEKGGNYGWNVKEGTVCFDASNNENILEQCPEEDVYGNELMDPVIVMNNFSNPAGGNTITIIGGYVYRGTDIPELAGKYIFGSFSQDFEPKGQLFQAIPAAGAMWSFNDLEPKSYSGNLGHYVKGLGQDLNGEIYVAASTNIGPSGNTGKILKLALVEE
ncbi:PQQ-dependent sugar dehydrogenase [Salinimicrobium sp. CDJ15-91]|uniref:PQQ-dependent sugar dehydrogenase n=2 Tax=Salinimicrobium oceani TaxID=2722702 RepID=A0ABX1CUG5_9FLAO|nr:PQQ-dependent sugar dehydrogenase [Salinimicrobium oceani]